MTSLTSRLGLKRWSLSDKWRNADLVDNWNALDAAPGTHVCTSDARPTTWGTDQTGRRIIETDTGLEFRWDGTGWQRIAARGLVNRTERLTLFSTTSFTMASVVATPSVAVKARRHLVIVEAPRVYSSVGLTALALFRDSTQLNLWWHQGGGGSAASQQPRPLAFTTTDQPTEGSVVYSLQCAAVVGFGGTSTIEPDTNRPCAITVVEV